MEEIETGMREAALRDGSKALSVILSEIPDHNGEGVDCFICDSQMDVIGRRDKKIVTLLGEGSISRRYHGCTNMICGSHRFPKDELLDIQDTAFSPGVRRLMAKSGSESAFEKARIDLEEYSAIKVLAKDLERISEKIGNEIKDWKKTETEETIKEHEKEWISFIVAFIGNIEEIINTAKQICGVSSQISAETENEINYFEENASRMRYAKYRAMGLFIGSGVIEAGCKNVIGKRLKQSGMRWSVKGANKPALGHNNHGVRSRKIKFYAPLSGISYKADTGIAWCCSVRGKVSWTRQISPPGPIGILNFCKTSNLETADLEGDPVFLNSSG